jgi:hypothetical protein
MMLSVLGRAAAAYASRFGLHVFPLLPGRKEPDGRLCPQGYLNATSDAVRGRRWWQRAPRANIGIAANASGVVILDVDPRHDGDATLRRLERELGALPSTWVCLTGGGGLHLYFRDAVGASFSSGAALLRACGAYVGALGDGLEVKYRGYGILPPSIHPSGTAYRWDVAQHPTETPIAELPVAWLARMTERRRGHALPSSGVDARESWLGAAFEVLGWLGDAMPDGRRMVRCPWVHEHTDERGAGQDTSAVIFPRAEGRTLGGFRCAHAHCAARTWRDVVAVLPSSARWHADRIARRARIGRVTGEARDAR